MSIEENITPSEVRDRLREYLDHNLAQRLQDEEFNKHYAMNRSERNIVGGDVKITKTQQRLEDELAIQQRRLANQTITESDEALAREIYAKYAEEEEQARNHLKLQLCQDEELAMSLSKEETKTPPSTPSESSLIDLGTHEHTLSQAVAAHDTNPFSATMPSTSTRSSLKDYGIPLPGLAENTNRSRSTTIDSADDPLPTPPSFVFEQISQKTSGQPNALEENSVTQPVSWPTTVPLLASNPFYNDVVQAMNALPPNSYNQDLINNTHIRQIPSHRPLTPNNSLTEALSYTCQGSAYGTVPVPSHQEITEVEELFMPLTSTQTNSPHQHQSH